ncbi:MAG: DUF3857 domain-containing protein [Bacteroidia bacterium]|nr:DUF3857 domain-containing protein [Bacteroidia bacterium]
MIITLSKNKNMLKSLYLPILLSASLLLSLPVSLSAQFSARLIPDSLKKDANAVIRSYNFHIQVKDERRAEMTVDQVITLMNRNADDKATLLVFYDKFDNVGEISGEIYDAEGVLVRKLKLKEIEDQAVSGGNFATDNRVFVARLVHDSYPYTVHFHYTTSIKGMFSFPSWTPMEEENTAVEHARLEITTPQSIRHKTVNIAGPEVSDNEGTTRYLWEVKSRPAIESEPKGPHWREYIPIVYLAPPRFEIEGYKGKNESWQDFGKFFHDLNTGRDKLPEALAQKVADLTKGLTTNEEKIAILYRYMQENTRYISIQLGLGGWQTFDAEYVYTNGYGDCKALTNYAKGMLSAVGITAYPALIYAGDVAPDILSDFSSNQFNHVILCVPNEGDTLWLECTSRNLPSGYLGQFTEDRYTLLVTPEGGKLIRTPSRPPEANRQERKAAVSLDKAGTAAVQVVVTSTGYQQDDLTGSVMAASEREKEQWLRESISAKSFELTAFRFEGRVEAEIPTFRYTYELKAPNWASASGTRFFLAPNQLERSNYIPEAVEKRTQPVVNTYPYWDTDTIEYSLPEGYVIETMPQMPLRVSSDFGEYEANIDFRPEAGKLIYTRSLLMHKTRQPAENYEVYRNFWRDITKADKIQVVLSGKS